MQIENIKYHLDAIDTLSEAQFELWGPLTGRNTLAEYRELLHFAAKSESLPTTLVAVENATVLGSVNILENDLPLRPDIAPWLAQLFVFPDFRRRGCRRIVNCGCDCRGPKAEQINTLFVHVWNATGLLRATWMVSPGGNRVPGQAQSDNGLRNRFKDRRDYCEIDEGMASCFMGNSRQMLNTVI